MSTPTQTTRTQTQQPKAPAPILIKGSWEDTFLQAQRLAATENDEAIPLYEKVIQGLRRMPEAQRQSNRGRLQQLLLSSTVNLQAYFAQRDRTDEALSVGEQLLSYIAPAERLSWEHHAVELLMQAGRHEEAIARLRARVVGMDVTLVDWSRLMNAYLQLGQIAEAETARNEAEQWANQQGIGAMPAAMRQDQHAYWVNLDADISLKKGEWEKALRQMKEVVVLNPRIKENLHLLYGRLLHYNRYEEALTLIERDQSHPVRSGFWRGVTLFRQGQKEAAEVEWRKVVEVDPKTSNEQSLTELIFAHYYLGDKEGAGLGAVLQALQKEGAGNWTLFFLAGLGWATRNKLSNATANLERAVLLRKRLAEGHQLPYPTWQICKDLLDEATQSELQRYFEQNP